jgi:hypothetical protein
VPDAAIVYATQAFAPDGLVDGAREGCAGTASVGRPISKRLAFLVQVWPLREEPSTEPPTGDVVVSVSRKQLWPKFWTLREAMSYACESGDLALVSVSHRYFVVKGAVQDAALVPYHPPVMAAPWPVPTLAVTHLVRRSLLTGSLTRSRVLLAVRDTEDAVEVDVAIDPTVDIDDEIERAGDVVFDAIPRSICVASFAREHVNPTALFSP